ncbi:MAG: hypothetical protein ACI93H_000072 [Psychromonas sp.]|jgi:hypothetical protein
MRGFMNNNEIKTLIFEKLNNIPLQERQMTYRMIRMCATHRNSIRWISLIYSACCFQALSGRHSRG